MIPKIPQMKGGLKWS